MGRYHERPHSTDEQSLGRHHDDGEWTVADCGLIRQRRTLAQGRDGHTGGKGAWRVVRDYLSARTVRGSACGRPVRAVPSTEYVLSTQYHVLTQEDKWRARRWSSAPVPSCGR